MGKHVPTLLLLSALLAGEGLADDGASMAGTVRDESGEALPGVSVTVESDALTGTRATVSNANGRYEFENLPPGAYKVSASLFGFKTIRMTNVIVDGSHPSERNVVMQLEDVVGDWGCGGYPSLVDTRDSQVRTVIDDRLFANLPGG